MVVARYIKKHYPDIKITTIDHRKFTRWAHSRHSDNHKVIPVNGHNDPEYVEHISKLIAELSIDVLIPINSGEQGIMLENRNRFGKALAYWGTDNDYQTLHDKDKFQKLVQNVGLKIPKSYENIETAQIPFVYKPTTASSSKGVVYVNNEAERQKLINEEQDTPKGKRVIQQFIEGQGAGFSGFFEKGDIVAGHAHIRLAEYPISGGSSVWRADLPKKHQKNIRNAVSTLLKQIPWSGFAMFEFKLTPNGELYFIECNPRIWGSIHQGLANDTNYFLSLLGKQTLPTKHKPNKQITTYLSPLIWVSFLQYALKGQFSYIWKFVKKWRCSRADINFFSDPLGWLGLALRSF